jgi:DNA-binding winged helix-turn-helix (wHTH) protein/Flp pilus assembly protein TadD
MTVGKSPKGSITVGEFTLDRDDERLWGPQGQVRLGNKAFMVLCRLIEEQGRLVTKDSLFASVWDGTIVSESALTSVVKELRRALGDDPKEPRYIQSVYGRGYRLVEAVLVRGANQGESSAQHKAPTSATARIRGSAIGQPPLLYVPAFDEAQLADTHPWLGAVIREEVLLALSRFRDIRLVSDIDKTTAPAPSHLAGERDYQLSIHLSNDGNVIRVFVKVSRLETQEIIWADRATLELENATQGVDILVRKIAAAALPRVYDDVTTHLPPRAEDAYGAYLQNKLAMRAADSLEEMKAVAREWEALLKAQPNFALAYAPLIRLYNTDYGYTGLGTTTDTERRRAYSLARKATGLDPAEPYLQTVSAWCHLWAGEAASARDHLKQALELNPFQRDRLLEVATALMFLGDLDEAAELLARCETLTPFATSAPHEEAGLLHLLLGHYDTALDCLARLSYPTTSSELYALLAARASGSSDSTSRMRLWAEQASRRWRGAASLDVDALSDWVLYHHPFQAAEQREWVLRLLRPALSEVLPARSHTHVRALPEGSSAPSGVPAPS